MPSLRKLRAGRIPGADASTWVGDYGIIFYNEATGTLRISDGETPGGNPLTLVSSDFEFTFGDFVASTPEDGSASLSSLQDNQDINIYSNGTGAVNLIGEVNIFAPDGDIYSRDPVLKVANDGQLTVYVSLLDNNFGAFEIVGSTTGNIIAPGQPGSMLHITGQLGEPNRTYLDGNNEYVSLVARRWNGSVASPTQVLANDYIFRINATAQTNAGTPNVATAQVLFKALENQTTTAQGSSIEFVTTPIGQSTANRVTVATIDVANGVSATKFTAAAGTTSQAPLTLTSGTNLTTAAAGNIEYDGKTLYFTPLGTQRGIVAANQWFLLDADRSITFNTTTAQSLFGVSPTLSANTRYYFRIKAIVSRTTGDNNTALTIGWAGTATLSRVSFTCQSKNGAVGTVGSENLVEHTITSNFANGYTLTAIVNPPSTHTIILTGIIATGASSGTVIPQITWTGGTAAGAVTVAATANWQLHPIGATGSNTSIGNWA